MTQIQTADVKGTALANNLKRFRCIDGIVQIERKKYFYEFDGSLTAYMEELAEFNSTLEDAYISHVEAYNDDDYLVEAKTFITGWTTDMTEHESKTAASLSWDS